MHRTAYIVRHVRGYLSDDRPRIDKGSSPPRPAARGIAISGADYLEYFPYDGMWVNEHRGQFVRIETDAA